MNLKAGVDIDPSKMGEGVTEILPGSDPVLQPCDIGGSQRIISICSPTMHGNEKKYVLECLDTNWISSAGQFIRAFESQFAAACGTQYAVACSSGTAALHLAVCALDIGPGSEVILPTFTMISTLNAVAYLGATPILVDAEARTWNMDLEQVAAKITPRTKLIIPVHTYGHPVDMDALNVLAEKNGIAILEDAAEAHGATCRGKMVGNLGHIAAFSFYANKLLTTGEGGILTTNNAELADLCRLLRDHAFSPERHFWHKYIGFNYRMTNLQAAIGLAQVERLPELLQARRTNARLYTERLKGISGLTLPPEAQGFKSSFWMYSILINPEFRWTRDELRSILAQKGIETRTFFIPMHLQPVHFETFKGQRYPVAEHICQRGLYLPSSSSLTVEEIDYITQAIAQAGKGQGAVP